MQLRHPMSLCILLVIAPLFCFSQTNISGIINSYHKVVELLPAKSCVRVDNTTGLVINDMVMMVQMKGAVVNTNNNSGFGSVTSMNNAGNYEINFICSIRGDSVFFYKQILQSYTVSDKVQLVKIPSYSSARVIDSLKAAPWDSASGKGGVLALSVSDDLILNAPLWAGHKGFLGGSYALSGSSCSNFFPASAYFYNAYNLNPQDGACKGESIADLSVSYSGGKGAVANGGGGGNNHNNGGGGGGNLSAGGLGGGNSSASGCATANAGRGGYALSNNSGTRIFPGGGGGAGHANSGFSTGDGGSGGGIIFVQANVLYSNGFTIAANGQKGDNALGDGASGGGGGGTIIMDVNIFPDAVSIEAKGGNGGDEDDDLISQKCYGEGGGGSGGVIFFKTALPPGIISVAGGAKGTKFNYLNCATLVAATAGTTGTLTPNYTYQQSSALSTTCTGTLAALLISFDARVNGNDISLSWKVTDASLVQYFIPERRAGNSPWQSLTVLPADPNQNSYAYHDINRAKGTYDYRLKMVEQDGSVKYSFIRRISTGERPLLVIYPNPADNQVTLEGPFVSGTSFRIIDDKGRLVSRWLLSKNEPRIRQNISFLPEGIYYVQSGDRVQRLIVYRK
jgi:hypothetical protein